jgi:RNA polymerase sigma-70 factor (ECF subfamily)
METTIDGDSRLEVSDQELVQNAVAGDDEAFHALVDRHAPALFRSALALSRNRADAEDLLQDTLVAAYRGLKNFAGRSSVKTWLVTILTRQGFKALHRSRHRRATLSLNALESAGSADGDVEDAGVVHHASPATSVEKKLDVNATLQSMSDLHREVLVLREIQGLSYEEIAAVLKVPRGTVESRLYRARAEFREKFGSPEAD